MIQKGSVKLRSALANFRGGKIVVSVIGVPHKCPVAPIEVTFILHDFLKRRGVRDRSQIVYTYPINKIFIMDSVIEMVQPMFEEKGSNQGHFSIPLKLILKRRKLSLSKEKQRILICSCNSSPQRCKGYRRFWAR